MEPQAGVGGETGHCLKQRFESFFRFARVQKRDSNVVQNFRLFKSEQYIFFVNCTWLNEHNGIKKEQKA